MSLKKTTLALLAGSALCAAAPASRAANVKHLDHVFVIMMENHGFPQLINNPYAPFINQEALSANLASNYFAVAHPSLTNYLEMNGGSNFGVLDDNPPDWHNANCQPNIVTGVTNLEGVSTPICPIAGTGTDAATPVIDYTNETSGPPGVINIDGRRSYASAPTVGATIADQLAAAGLTWKSYQESLPMVGADNVNDSDGNFTNLTNFTPDEVAQNETTANIVQLYAVKHDPFAYFASVQSGTVKGNTLANVVPFDGSTGLYADLAAGKAPTYSFIVPNQCNDQHGRGNGTPFCAYDPNDNGTQNGLNPALITLGDQAVQKIVTSIKASPMWMRGQNAIVIVWDESDYSIKPITNQVVTIVDTNKGAHGIQSGRFYTHFSLLRTIEDSLGLPCLNHACDASTHAMDDVFR